MPLSLFSDSVLLDRRLDQARDVLRCWPESTYLRTCLPHWGLGMKKEKKEEEREASGRAGQGGERDQVDGRFRHSQRLR